MNVRNIAYKAVAAHRACQFVDELTSVLAFIQIVGRPKTVVEVGSEYGGTLWAWSQIATDDAVLISVDADQSKNKTKARAQQKLIKIEADSGDPETLYSVHEVVGPAVDFVYIDGDHTYEGARTDWNMYGRLGQPHGIVGFHDAFTPDLGVRRLWDEIAGNKLMVYAERPEYPRWLTGTGIVLPDSLEEAVRGT